MDEQRKPGRPPGTTDTPEDLSRRELVRGLKLYRKIIDDIEQHYKDNAGTMTIKEKMELATFLKEAVISLMKSVVPPPKTGSAESEEVDIEKVLANL